MSAISNRTLFINYLRFWWNATPMAVLRLSTFQDAVAFYDAKGDFVEKYGATLQNIAQEKVRLAHERLAKDYGSKYPDPSVFYKYLSEEAGSFSWTDVGDVARATVQDIQDVAKTGIYLYVGIAALGLAFLLYSKGKKS